MAAGILGTGAYLPEQLLTNQELALRFDVTPDWILERTGILQRHSAAPEQACSDLAIIAAREALKNAAIEPEKLGMIIVATTTLESLVVLFGFGGGMSWGSCLFRWHVAIK